MPLTLEEPLTVANQQTIKFSHLQITVENSPRERQLWSEVVFDVFDENGKNTRKQHVIRYQGEDFNKWWDDFSSGGFLYEQLKSIKEFNIEIPDNIENDFVNTIKEA
jgi:hypothetical protein